MEGTPIKQLVDMSPRARAALLASGITTIEMAQAMTDDQLLALFGFAKASLDKLRAWRPEGQAADVDFVSVSSADTTDSLETTTWTNRPDYERVSDGARRDQLINLATDLVEILVREHKKTAPQSMDEAFAIAARCYRNIDVLNDFFDNYRGPETTNPFVQARDGGPTIGRPVSRLTPSGQRRIVAGAENLAAREQPHLPARRVRHAVPIATAILKPPPSADPDDEASWDDSHLDDYSEQDY